MKLANYFIIYLLKGCGTLFFVSRHTLLLSSRFHLGVAYLFSDRFTHLFIYRGANLKAFM